MKLELHTELQVRVPRMFPISHMYTVYLQQGYVPEEGAKECTTNDEHGVTP
jgi:hypothetical protein